MSRALWVAVALSLLVPTAVGRTADQPEILTLPSAPEPRSNGAKVFGVRLGIRCWGGTFKRIRVG